MNADLNKPEPAPIKTNQAPIWPLVIKDMEGRYAAGMAKYGTPLQADNGRDALVDAYQEALDMCVYLRQELERRRQAGPFHIEARHDELDISRLLDDERVRRAINDSLVELARAERLHPVWPEDVMEQICLMLDRAKKSHSEAVDVAYHNNRASLPALRHRITQTIAMGIRCLINLEVK